MANDYYTASGAPATRSTGSSSTIRAEYNLLVAAFDKLPALTGNGSQFVRVNSAGTALESVTATVARTGLGVAIGTDVQAYHLNLQQISALTIGLNDIMYGTGFGGFTTTTVTSFARTLLDDSSAATMRATLGGVQKNSDITKAEIEAKLTGEISTHTHDVFDPSNESEIWNGDAASVDLNNLPDSAPYPGNGFYAVGLSSPDAPANEYITIYVNPNIRSQSSGFASYNATQNAFVQFHVSAVSGFISATMSLIYDPSESTATSNNTRNIQSIYKIG